MFEILLFIIFAVWSMKEYYLILSTCCTKSPSQNSRTIFWVSFLESIRLSHDISSMKEKIKENKDKVKVNKTLPYLVANVIELLDVDGEDQEEDGANVDLDAQVGNGVSCLGPFLRESLWTFFLDNGVRQLQSDFCILIWGKNVLLRICDLSVRFLSLITELCTYIKSLFIKNRYTDLMTS